VKPLLIFTGNGNDGKALGCIIGDACRFIGFVGNMPKKKAIDPIGYQVLNKDAFAQFSDARVLAIPGSTILIYLEKRSFIA
jgi:hypothetical protein